MYKSTGGNGLSTAYTYDGTQLIHEEKGGHEVWYQYDADGSPIGVEIDGASYLYLKNAQNDIIGLVDENGTVVARYVYNAWGEVLSVTDQNGQEVTSKTHVANLNGLRYRGYYYDVDLGWYYLNTRYYDPLAKRFLNADSYFDTRNVCGGNLYAFCQWNPVSNVDPTGEFSIKNICIGVGIGVAIVGLAVAVTALSVATAGVGAAVLTSGIVAVGGTSSALGVATTGVGIMVIGTTLAVGSNHLLPDNIQLKENIRDSGLVGIPDEEIKRLYKNAKGKDKLRYQKELKARQQRNMQKRKSHYSPYIDINHNNDSKLHENCTCGHHYKTYTEPGVLLC